MSNTRQRYSSEYKVKIVLEILSNTGTLTEIAGKYGLHPTMISGWKTEFLERSKEIFSDPRIKKVDNVLKEKDEALDEADKKYPYLLKNVEITHSNQVWSTDITYIRMKRGFIYLIAIIDWYSRKVLYWRVSNSMDGKGRYADNIFIERLWRTIKQEEVYLREYNSPIEAMISLKKYMIFYNSQRPHQSLGYKTPKEVYEYSLRKLQNLKI